jgi:hypothetical protein
VSRVFRRFRHCRTKPAARRQPHGSLEISQQGDSGQRGAQWLTSSEELLAYIRENAESPEALGLPRIKVGEFWGSTDGTKRRAWTYDLVERRRFTIVRVRRTQPKAVPDRRTQPHSPAIICACADRGAAAHRQDRADTRLDGMSQHAGASRGLAPYGNRHPDECATDMGAFRPYHLLATLATS